jgi:LacI family transcriptional regulator
MVDLLDGVEERAAHQRDALRVLLDAGFDNWEMVATQTRPPLTTVDMNLHDLGRAAAERLLARLEGDREAGAVRLPCSLVVRESG